MWYIELAKLVVELVKYFAQKRTPTAMSDIRDNLKALKNAKTVEEKEVSVKRISDWLNQL